MLPVLPVSPLPGVSPKTGFQVPVIPRKNGFQVTVLPVSPLLRRPTSNMPRWQAGCDLSEVEKPDEPTASDKKCEGCDDTMPLAGSRYCSICGTFWEDLQKYMFRVLDKKKKEQLKSFGDAQEFRVRAIGQWNRAQSQDEFALMMELVMPEFETKGFHAQKKDKKKDGKKGNKKDGKEDEKKDEQEDEDSEDSEDMNHWQESPPLVTMPS